MKDTHRPYLRCACDVVSEFFLIMDDLMGKEEEMQGVLHKAEMFVNSLEDALGESSSEVHERIEAQKTDPYEQMKLYKEYFA